LKHCKEKAKGRAVLVKSLSPLIFINVIPIIVASKKPTNITNKVY